MIQVIYEDSDYIAIDKDQGYHVHPPENSLYKVPKDRVCLYLVRNYLNSYVYPIHRLDSPTSGVLIFGKHSEASGKFQKLIQEKQVSKKYIAVARGYTKDEGVIDKDLLSDSSDLLLPSVTTYRTLGKIDLPYPVGKKHPSSRYSLLEVEPKTGRYHQIRRHLASESHPLIGDIKHGDSYHNRFFRETLQMPGLFLHALSLKFVHPYSLQEISIQTDYPIRWQKIFEMFNAVPSSSI